MQDKGQNMQDLELRSMLAGAEEKVPSGAWKAICARLDAAAPAPSRGFSWGWAWSAAAGLAVAGLAAVLFLRETSVPEVAQPEVVVSSEYLASVDVLPVDSEASIALVASVDVVPADLDAAADMTLETVNGGDVSITTSPAASVSPAARDLPAGSESRADVSDEPVRRTEPDIFEIMGREDAAAAARLSRRTSMVLSGSLLGVENSRSFIVNRSSGNVATTAGRIIETSTSTYGIPFSVGAGVRWTLGKRFAVGTGLDFSLLTRSFTGQYTPESGPVVEGDINHTMIYLGVPVNFFVNVIESPTMRFYMFTGGEAEYCVYNNYFIREFGVSRQDPVNAVQFSAALGLGVEFKLSERLRLFLDPGVNFYFNCNQPKSVRTDQQLMFNFDAGLRFDL